MAAFGLDPSSEDVVFEWLANEPDEHRRSGLLDFVVAWCEEPDSERWNVAQVPRLAWPVYVIEVPGLDVAIEFLRNDVRRNMKIRLISPLDEI